MSFHFVLKQQYYDAIKSGEKTSEWRDGTEFWISRLLNEEGRSELKTFKSGYESFEVWYFCPKYWKYVKARFVVGYTKAPMLLADVTGILYHRFADQFQVQLGYVEEKGDF